MRTIVIILLIVSSNSLTYAQLNTSVTENKNLNLKDRYKEMKSTSQTFKDYKVIKEVVLDKVWDITMDSIEKKELQLAEARQQITNLEQELINVRNSLQAQQDEVKDISYDSTHITVLGIPFLKSAFILLTVAIIGGLAFVISVILARVKIANRLVKEKSLIADSISHEFEDFKKRSMEKQTKLSRELQTERNRWQEYRKS